MKTSYTIIMLHLFIAAALFITPSAAETLPTSIVPVVQTARWAQKWWMPRHEEKLAEAKMRGKEVKLLFIGDSITHHWDEGLWAKHFAKYGAFNLGFSGDRTEHVLWRIEHGALENLSPELTVLMIGTNNVRTSKPDETLKGIKAIIKEIKQRLPKTKILLHSIFPRSAKANDKLRLINRQINKKLPELAKSYGVELLNINRLFLERDGTLSKHVMPDLLHPNETGYKLWAKALEPVLKKQFTKEKMKEKSKEVIELWPTETVPEANNTSQPETSETRGNVTRISHVSVPEMIFYPSKNKRKPAPCVLVCPGGGYHILAWDLEGTEIAEWLNSIGFSAAVLKYRVPENREGALQDAQRALGILRHRSKELNLNPDKIGILGFSAGGHLSATVSNNWKTRAYEPVDAADKLNCRPAFTALVYPAYLGDKDLNLVKDVVVNKETPPAFIVQTQDDSNYVPSAFAYSSALHKVNVSCEFHLFPLGKHGYGLRPSGYAVSGWTDLCRDWLLGIASR